MRSPLSSEHPYNPHDIEEHDSARTSSIPVPPDEAFYRVRCDRFARQRDIQAHLTSRLTNARLLVFLAASLCLGWAVWQRNLVYGGVGLLLLIGFFALVYYHGKADRLRRRYEELVKINEEAGRRLAHAWDDLPLRHEVPVEPDHPYTADLDIFGRASLFHLLDSVTTSLSDSTLSRWLRQPAPPETARARQAAIAELAPLADLRDELLLRDRLVAGDRPNPEPFLQWAEGDRWLMQRPGLLWAARVSPVLLVISFLAQLAGFIPYPVWIIFFTTNILLNELLGRPAHRILSQITGQRETMFGHYADRFQIVSEAPFHAPILKRLQTELRTGGVPAHQHLRRLHRLVTLVIPGSAIIHWLVQSVTLWDVHVLAALERWQAKAGDQARAWLAALSEIEALAALAVLAHDNPDWAFPDLNPDAQSLVARDLGHPLLPRSVRVLNDVEVGPPGTFLLVTGSNMSGKSTLLRALGVNIALAQAGGPVCASALQLPAVDLWTSMRIQDSLAMGVSYFMAELQRLKQIVDAARQNHGRAEIKTFYLLDEILQGTNTFERQIAARRIIRCLVDLGAIGAVSTHDLTLVDADELAEVAHSTYFTETISTDPARPAMSFDYKLHPGIATSSNALKLMKLIGLNTDVSAKS